MFDIKNLMQHRTFKSVVKTISDFSYPLHDATLEQLHSTLTLSAIEWVETVLAPCYENTFLSQPR